VGGGEIWGGGGDLDIKLLEALVDVEAMEQDLPSSHHCLRKFKQDSPLLNELAPVYSQLRLHPSGNSVQPTYKK
jgi:hypothetical protein